MDSLAGEAYSSTCMIDIITQLAILVVYMCFCCYSSVRRVEKQLFVKIELVSDIVVVLRLILTVSLKVKCTPALRRLMRGTGMWI